MMLLLYTIALLSILASAGHAADKPPAIRKGVWPNKPYAKVIGHRFKVPSDDVKEPGVPSGFSLLHKSGVDTKQLA